MTSVTSSWNFRKGKWHAAGVPLSPDLRYTLLAGYVSIDCGSRNLLENFIGNSEWNLFPSIHSQELLHVVPGNGVIDGLDSGIEATRNLPQHSGSDEPSPHDTGNLMRVGAGRRDQRSSYGQRLSIRSPKLGGLAFRKNDRKSDPSEEAVNDNYAPPRCLIALQLIDRRTPKRVGFIFPSNHIAALRFGISPQNLNTRFLEQGETVLCKATTLL